MTRQLFAIFICCCLIESVLCFSAAHARQFQSPKKPNSDAIESTIDEKNTPGSGQTGMALESTVDPEKYYVGPSDAISVNIWLSPPLNMLLTVTPEGTLIIPAVGEVHVADLTLASAKELVIKQVRKRYIAGEITATLIRPRPIIVSVVGAVLNPGLYTLNAIDRANKAIDVANNPTRTQSEDAAAQIAVEASTRNIVVKHRNSTEDRVDIPKYFASHENRTNPYLREGDVIIVPRKNLRKNVIAIYGEVNAPGRYEYVKGDSLHDAILLAQGFTKLAIEDSIEFTRLNLDGTDLTLRYLNAQRILESHQDDFALEPGDRIVVKAKKELREDYRVVVQGEVVHPGVYPITKDRTRLSEVIMQAGGFTDFAALKSAELIRRSVGAAELEMERLMSSRGGVASQDSSDYFVETELRIRKEIVNVDFDRLFENKDSTQDVILQGEDLVTVPSVKKTVYVFGQIVSPGHIPFIPKRTVDYYIGKAGGFTERARRGDVKIVKGKTKQWLAPNETTIEDGDYVWVPKNPDRSFAYYMNIASQAASVLSVMVGIGVIIVQVTK